ncbi:MarR family transcriptional regulator [Actinoplanes sp. NEAU-A12]|uniref:MarR family transcriptional regulator n=1 Tax=Actinoplanes sandaracinus TaxID=3045177 RepID=A0ABT6WV63_9ACTN|nr:MarR family transcriptional regulator [Actinoplanes sandaracinus]MDI6103630.1 MarR family transcriptional regulator [Actinoplanes sandaracinus]
MVIGLVVHSGHRERFAEAARTLTGVSFAWAVYEREEQIRERVSELLAAGDVDGLLLGLVPWARARDLLPAGLPVAVTRSAALDLALAWARARGNGWPATPVSIDTFAIETVDEVATALDLDRAAIATLPFDAEQSLGEVVAFHRDHLDRTAAPYVITVRTGVSAALDGRTAVLHALATPGTIRADLTELVLRVRRQRADGQRFAAAVFRSPATGTRAALRRTLREIPELADAWVEEHGPHGVVAFAPAAVFEKITQHWVMAPVPWRGRPGSGEDPLPEQGSLGAFAGFGIGPSARRSVALAEQAADRAEQDGPPTAYLITDDGVMIGPMGAAGPPLTYTYRQHGGLEDLAGRSGLSPATLSRLAALERSLGGRPISPGELADALGITDPSGRRLVRKLTEAGLAVADGSTQPHHKGRPARLYRLAITAALSSGRSPAGGLPGTTGDIGSTTASGGLPSASAGDTDSAGRGGR